jgi:excisionase family DNA binding protein
VKRTVLIHSRTGVQADTLCPLASMSEFATCRYAGSRMHSFATPTTNATIDGPKDRQERPAASDVVAPLQSTMHITSITLPSGSVFMSLREVAVFLGVSPVTVYRLVDRGLLTVYRVARRLRFTQADVLRFLEHQKTNAIYGRPQD